MQYRRSSLAIAVLAVTLVAVVAVQEHRLNEARGRSADLALQKDSAAAAADTTRDLVIENPKVASIAGDSLSIVQHRIIQVRQEKDALSVALNTERIAKAGMAVTIDSLQRAISSRSAVVEDSSTRIRRADFGIRQAPYTVAAAVELPPAPDTGRMALRIALDQIPVVARLSCSPPNADGIRPASIDATTPAWASLKFNAVEQSPDLCRSPALDGKAVGHWRPSIVIGIGVVAPSTNELQLGGFAGVGFAFSR